VTIPHVYRQCEAMDRISAFDLSFHRPLPAPIVLIFGDSNVVKWVEVVSLALATHPDPVLESLINEVVDKITSRATSPWGV